MQTKEQKVIYPLSAKAKAFIASINQFLDGQETMLEELWETTFIAANKQKILGLKKILIEQCKVGRPTVKDDMVVLWILPRIELQRFALFHIVDNGDFADLEDLVTNAGVSINLPDDNGKTALMRAAERNDIGMIDILLRHYHANINQQDRDGNTALMLAELSERHEAIELLSARGADYTIGNHAGILPVAAAAYMHQQYAMVPPSAAIYQQAPLTQPVMPQHQHPQWPTLQAAGAALPPPEQKILSSRQAPAAPSQPPQYPVSKMPPQASPVVAVTPAQHQKPVVILKKPGASQSAEPSPARVSAQSVAVATSQSKPQLHAQTPAVLPKMSSSPQTTNPSAITKSPPKAPEVKPPAVPKSAAGAPLSARTSAPSRGVVISQPASKQPVKTPPILPKTSPPRTSSSSKPSPEVKLSSAKISALLSRKTRDQWRAKPNNATIKPSEVSPITQVASTAEAVSSNPPAAENVTISQSKPIISPTVVSKEKAAVIISNVNQPQDIETPPPDAKAKNSQKPAPKKEDEEGHRKPVEAPIEQPKPIASSSAVPPLAASPNVSAVATKQQTDASSQKTKGENSQASKQSQEHSKKQQQLTSREVGQPRRNRKKKQREEKRKRREIVPPIAANSKVSAPLQPASQPAASAVVVPVSATTPAEEEHRAAVPSAQLAPSTPISNSPEAKKKSESKSPADAKSAIATEEQVNDLSKRLAYLGFPILSVSKDHAPIMKLINVFNYHDIFAKAQALRKIIPRNKSELSTSLDYIIKRCTATSASGLYPKITEESRKNVLLDPNLAEFIQARRQEMQQALKAPEEQVVLPDNIAVYGYITDFCLKLFSNEETTKKYPQLYAGIQSLNTTFLQYKTLFSPTSAASAAAAPVSVSAIAPAAAEHRSQVPQPQAASLERQQVLASPPLRPDNLPTPSEKKSDNKLAADAKPINTIEQEINTLKKRLNDINIWVLSMSLDQQYPSIIDLIEASTYRDIFSRADNLHRKVTERNDANKDQLLFDLTSIKTQSNMMTLSYTEFTQESAKTVLTDPHLARFIEEQRKQMEGALNSQQSSPPLSSDNIIIFKEITNFCINLFKEKGTAKKYPKLYQDTQKLRDTYLRYQQRFSLKPTISTSPIASHGFLPSPKPSQQAHYASSEELKSVEKPLNKLNQDLTKIKLAIISFSRFTIEPSLWEAANIVTQQNKLLTVPELVKIYLASVSRVIPLLEVHNRATPDGHAQKSEIQRLLREYKKVQRELTTLNGKINHSPAEPLSKEHSSSESPAPF